MYCQNCGFKYDGKGAFCPQCGAKTMPDAESTVFENYNAAPQDAGETYYQPPAQEYMQGVGQDTTHYPNQYQQTSQQGYQQPQPQYTPNYMENGTSYVTGQQPNYQPVQQAGNPTKVLVFCILGLALFGTGIPGIIFSIIGLRKANQYIAAFGNISNQVRIGRRLAIAGLILSILMTVFWVAYFIIVAILISQYSAIRYQVVY